jgi:hypothetical protein
MEKSPRERLTALKRQKQAIEDQIHSTIVAQERTFIKKVRELIGDPAARLISHINRQYMIVTKAGLYFVVPTLPEKKEVQWEVILLNMSYRLTFDTSGKLLTTTLSEFFRTLPKESQAEVVLYCQSAEKIYQFYEELLKGF